MEVCVDASVSIVPGGRSLDRQPHFPTGLPRRLTRACSRRADLARDSARVAPSGGAAKEA